MRGTPKLMKHPVISRVAVGSLLVCGVLVVTNSSPTQATDPAVYSDSVVATVDNSAPSSGPGAVDTPLDLSQVSNTYVGTAPTANVTVSAASADSVSISRPGEPSMEVGLPAVGASAGQLNSGEDAVVYAPGTQNVAVAVQTFDEGVQIATVLNSSASPETYQYTLDIPAGGSATLTDEEGVAVLDAAGDPVGVITAPWARDSTGRKVPTEYSLTGNILTQHVLHQGGAFSYPVVADPYLFKDLIRSAEWDWISRSADGKIGAGWILEVTPTKWARLNAGGYMAGYYGWRELKKKYYICCNLDAMEDQYICHQQFVAVRYPRKPTWNLDEWRKDVSYAATVKASCNPPRGGPYAE